MDKIEGKQHWVVKLLLHQVYRVLQFHETAIAYNICTQFIHN
jgi:hypothetical protein